MHQRIISLVPSGTEIVSALGCSRRMVGRSHACDYPAEMRNLPVCTEARISVETTSAQIDAQVRHIMRDALSVYRIFATRVRDLQPDIIITQSQCEFCAVSHAELEAETRGWLGREVRIVSLEPHFLADVHGGILHIAEALEVPAEGKSLVAAMKARADEIARTAAKASSRPRVACIEWTDPPMNAGHWIPELVDLAGGREVLAAAGKYARYLEWEELLAADPDAIVFMPCGYGLKQTGREAKAMSARPGFAGMAAARNGRLYITDASQYFSRPGPRLAESLEILSEILHPELFHFGHRGIGWDWL